MKLHFLVEGPADFSFLEQLLPRLIPGHPWQIYPHQGKGKLPGDPTKAVDPTRRGLLDNLAPTLRAWGRVFDPATDRVVVLVDKDDDDCRELLKKLHQMYGGVKPRPSAIFRLAIEEAEAWYLGDPKAVKKAYPKARNRKLSDWAPDSGGGTWEYFRDVIGAANDDKVGWAEALGRTLSVDEPLESRNRSPSFRSFCRRVRSHAGDQPARIRRR